VSHRVSLGLQGSPARGTQEPKGLIRPLKDLVKRLQGPLKASQGPGRHWPPPGSHRVPLGLQGSPELHAATHFADFLSVAGKKLQFHVFSVIFIEKLIINVFFNAVFGKKLIFKFCTDFV
jgi:hypothetical protein